MKVFKIKLMEEKIWQKEDADVPRSVREDTKKEQKSARENQERKEEDKNGKKKEEEKIIFHRI